METNKIVWIREKVDSNFYSNYIDVAEVNKSATNKIVISTGTKNDKNFVNIREWYMRDDEWKVGRQGMALELEDAKALTDVLVAMMESL